jgi:hypothetical protein
MIRILASAALVALAPSAFAQAPAAPRMSEAEQTQVQHALDRGTLIYYYDQAAWHGTDDLLKKIPNPEGKVGGWIVDGTADAAEIVFYDTDEADPHAVYVAKFRGSELVSSRLLDPGDDRTLSPSRRSMIAAKRTASNALAESEVARCVDKPFNTVVLPPGKQGEPTLVYFLTPQTRNATLPFGGHYLVPVGADGTPGKIRAFAKSCGELETGKDGNKAEALIVTHLLDATPTEIHVFTMMAARLPLFVMTSQNNRVWSVDFVSGRARIRIVDPGKKVE